MTQQLSLDSIYNKLLQGLILVILNQLIHFVFN